MSIFRRAVDVPPLYGRYPQFNNYVAPLSQLYGATNVTSAAGERIDEWTALGLSSVFSCVSILSNTVSTLPLRAYKIIDGQRQAVELPEIIKNPDPESSTVELISMMMISAALHGNAYVHIDRNRSGKEIGLVPLHPYQMQVLPTGDQIGRRYLHLGNQLSNEDIIHMRWITPPQSLVGVSPLIQTRNLTGLGLAMDRHLAQWYAEGGTPSSVLETDQKLTNEQAQIIRNTWEATHRRHRRPAVLSDGLKWKPISASAADMEMLGTREQFQADIARVFGIPAHMIGVKGDGQTYQNVEQASLNFLTYTVAPWLRRIEVALSKVLPNGVDLAFDTSALLRTDALTRARVQQMDISSGILSPNEARQIQGREPYDGGDKFNQALMGSVTAGGQTPELGTDNDTSTPVMGVLE